MAARRAFPELGGAHTYICVLESAEVSGLSNTEVRSVILSMILTTGKSNVRGEKDHDFC